VLVPLRGAGRFLLFGQEIWAEVGRHQRSTADARSDRSVIEYTGRFGQCN
jgi:hypothetical protein